MSTGTVRESFAGVVHYSGGVPMGTARRQLLFMLLLFIFVLPGSPACATPIYTLSLINSFKLPRGTPEQLSGITYLSDHPVLTGPQGFTPNFIAVSDKDGKVVTLDITIATSGSSVGQITAAKMGSIFAVPGRESTLDFEGIAYTNATRRSVFLSHEGRQGQPAAGIFEYELPSDGSLELKKLQQVTVPEQFTRTPAHHQPNPGQQLPNVRENNGLESLTRKTEANGTQTAMWTVNEQALRDDGTRATDQRGTLVRLVKYGVSGNDNTPTKQFAYWVDPVHKDGTNPTIDGISDLVVLPDGTVLSMERSLCVRSCGGVNLETRFYQLDFSKATDVSEIADLIDPQAMFTPVSKELLLKGAFGSSAGMNLEGLALGPELSAEKGTRAWSLIAVVDSGGLLEPYSDNRLVAFKLVKTIPEPPSILLIGLGLGWLTIRRYRNSR